MSWEVGEGTTFLFFIPICTIFSIWSLVRFVSPPLSSSRKIMDTTGESSGRLKALNIRNPASILLCMRYWAEFGFILLYIWMCEKSPALPHGARFSNSFLFWSLWCVFIAWSLYNIVENKGGAKSATLLNREQSEEWKGWMQYLFLAYHYFHEASVYNAIRVFVSCYVWMTGFGNFSFFYTKADFGIVRMLQMMWRLNFLVFWLCLMFGNTFILYYINPLHTFYFLTTFFVMRIGHTFNTNKWKIRTKLFVWSFIIFIVWEFPVVFNTVWGSVLGTKPNPGAKSGTLHEWHFRSSLDHWSAVFGMIFALNYPAAVAWLKRVEGKPMKTTGGGGSGNGGNGGGGGGSGNNNSKEAETKTKKTKRKKLQEGTTNKAINITDEASDASDASDENESLLVDHGEIGQEQTTSSSSSSSSKTQTTATNNKNNPMVLTSPYSSYAKLIVLIPFLIGTGCYFIFVYPSNKKVYNALHPYYFWIPLLTYVLLRNWTPTLRQYHSSSLASMGKITLETYLMQHHIWLANNAKKLYVVVPNAPFLNLCITTVTYVFVAYRLFRITVGLRAIHVSEIEGGGPWTCIIQVCAVCIAVFVPYVLSCLLVSFNIATTSSYVTCAVVMTLILGLVFVCANQTCWKKYNDTLNNITSSIQTDRTTAISVKTTATAKTTAASHGRRICGKKPVCFNKIPVLLLVLSVTLQCCAYLVWPSTNISYHTYADPKAYRLWENKGKKVMNIKGVTEQGNEMLWRNVSVASDLTKGRTLSLYGDSIGRETLKAFGRLISGRNKTTVQFDMNDRHKDKFFTEPNGAVLKFYWSPFAAVTAKRIAALDKDQLKRNEIIVISNGPWDMLHHPCKENSCGGQNGAGLFASDVDMVLDTIDTTVRSSTVLSQSSLASTLWITPTLVVHNKLPPAKAAHMTVQAGWNYRQVLVDRSDRLDEILDGTTLTDPLTEMTTKIDEDNVKDDMLYSKDGVHYESIVYENIAQGILNFIQKPIPIASGDPRKIQSLAGISNNVLLGTFVLMALISMLLTFDIYLGFSSIARMVLQLPTIDVEAVYDELHKTIDKIAKLW